MKNTLLIAAIVFISLYIVICILVYFYQEKMIFLAQRLPADYRFQFDQPFEELAITTKDNKKLSAVLFKAENSKGVIFYLHGNAGSIASWGGVAAVYTELQYDVFMIDYRGYGKSQGRPSGERPMMEDMHLAFEEIKKRYDETMIVILGYSLGSGPATQLAAANNPRMLILQAPYYSLKDIAKKVLPIVPVFLLKYPFETYRFLPACKMPVVIFHGDRDQVIPYDASVRLSQLLKAGDTLITINGLGHNGMTDNIEYRRALKKILE